MTALQTYIKEHKIQAEILQVATPFPTIRHVARYLDTKEDQFYITQLLQGENKRLVVCIYRGKNMLDFKKIEKITGIRRLRFADREMIQKNTGFAADGVPPIGFKDDVKVIMDEGALDLEEGFALGGDAMTFIKMRAEDIKDINKAEVEKIVQ